MMNAKNMLEGNGVFIGIGHGIGSLFFKSINGANPGHDPIGDIHEHGTGKQKGPNRQNRHTACELDQYGMEHAGGIGTKKVIVNQQGQGQHGTEPRINQKQ
jgi:hypothetical protein